MRLELGGRVDCGDGTFGALADVVVDPTTTRVPHLVVKAQREPWVERLVPVELVGPGVREHRAVTLRAPAEEAHSLPPVTYDLQPQPLDCPSVRPHPEGEVEIRRASGVHSVEGTTSNTWRAFQVDRDEHITHLVLERGRLLGQRDVTIPIGVVAKVETDDVTLNLTKDEVGSLPDVAFVAGRRRARTAAVPRGVAAAWQRHATKSSRQLE